MPSIYKTQFMKPVRSILPCLLLITTVPLSLLLVTAVVYTLQPIPSSDFPSLPSNDHHSTQQQQQHALDNKSPAATAHKAELEKLWSFDVHSRSIEPSAV
jgi:hypothetical protein